MVSIVIPIYNSEKYLARCIQSLVAQTEPEIEIILVNDGSSDSSGYISDEWAKKDSRIKVIHRENDGVTNARKAGVEHSTGDWICFVDSDDILPEQSIYTLSKHIRDDVDMIIGTLEYNGYFKVSRRYNYEEQNALQYLKYILKNKVHNGPVARLIRKSLFDNRIFDIPPKITRGEDVIMNIRLAQKIRLVILLPDTVYNYLWNSESVSSKSRSFKEFINYEIFWHRMVMQSINPDFKKKLKWAILYFYCRQLYWLLLKKNFMLLKNRYV
ncbi:MAG: glycosyltransferase [Fibromonadaceae bacterium]|nr:glycosyltransferase [Fibromonadaceae bacterium]